MGVRYVLTAVLPRYTMRRPTGPAPAAVADAAITDTAQRFATYLRVVKAQLDRHDARVMGHE